MKILRIREGKMKLSLTPEEATSFGIARGRVISSKDLCAIVRRLLKNEREGDALGGILAEAYPKADGSCDIFVTEEGAMEKRKEKRGRRQYGFGSAEDLAFALYMLSKSKNGSPLCGESGEEDECPSVLSNEIGVPPSHRREDSLPREVYDFFVGVEPKSENLEGDSLSRRLPGISLYKTEHTDGDGEAFGYILSLEEGETSALANSLCEFGRELSALSAELLAEHTHPIEVGELFHIL